ncbi:hypothetical protein ABT150_34895 [Streptomyces mirabilis]|uniref:hypothetical protein n=1 Tax=Streptomyces mirabilis TaxID=68239 RepID=UPI00331FE89A
MDEGQQQGRGSNRRRVVVGAGAAAGAATARATTDADGSERTAQRRATAAPAVGRAPAATATAAPGGNRSGLPNILVVVTDDQPKETEWATPETVDRLGGRGVTFERAHVNAPSGSTGRVRNRSAASASRSRPDG